MDIRRAGLRTCLAAGAATLIVGALAAPGSATVRPTPASGTPQLSPSGHTEQVRRLVECGGTMYAAGTFTKIRQGASGTVYTRHNVFSFRATAPFTVTSWAPKVNGTVNTIAFGRSGCGTAYIGGSFTSVNGKAAANIAAISTSTGALIRGFAHNANGTVETIASHAGHLLTGGFFTAINGSAHGYFASLNPANGKLDGYLQLGVSGHYSYCNSNGKCTGRNPTRVYNQRISHNGSRDVVEGDFTRVGGLHREQAFILNLGRSHASVSGWIPSGFYEHCWYKEPFYVHAGAWSSNDSTVYFATTGYHINNWDGKFPLTGPCDAAIAYPSTGTKVNPRWHNYTGCDSLYSTAADATTAYFAGHERWSQNPSGCDHAGRGAVSAPGMEGLSPATGQLIFNPHRARGQGADDMLITGAGLWIASDNYLGSDTCGGVSGHAGICLFPY